VDERNVPLGLHEQWKDNLAAQCWLWKDHTIMKDLIHIVPRMIDRCGKRWRQELMLEMVSVGALRRGPPLRGGGGVDMLSLLTCSASIKNR
jgi:hypothetical protein